MNLTRHFFFFAVSAGIVHFQLPNLVYLRVVFVCFFLLYINLHNGLMGHSKNLGNIKVKVTFTTRKPPLTKYLTGKIVQFFISFFFFLRGKGGAAIPQEPVSYAYDSYYIQCFTSLMFNKKNLVTLKGQLLKVQFSELQCSC